MRPEPWCRPGRGSRWSRTRRSSSRRSRSREPDGTRERPCYHDGRIQPRYAGEHDVPLDFLKRKGNADAAPVAPPPSAAASILMPEEVVAQDHQLKLYYAGKSSEGVRLKAGPAAIAELPTMLVGLARSEIEVVEPLPIEFSQATPTIVSPSEAMQWLNAHHVHSPITRHALVVLESIDAVDLAFDTFVCALLDGEVDTSGYPEYNAIVGGVAAHWDEATGDMICRAVVGWGGKGVRGDTDRIGTKLLGGVLSNILASQYALGLTPIERPVPAAGRGGLVCAHCGFASAHERAFYCPKCGMRLLRG